MATTFDLLDALGITHNLHDAAEPEAFEAVGEVVHGSCALPGERFSEGAWGTSEWEFRCDRCDGAPSPRMVGILVTCTS